MKLGAGEWGYREIPVERHAEITAKFGFHYMELGIGGEFPGRLQTNMPEAEIANVAASIKKYNLLTPFMCLENDFSIRDKAKLEQEIARVCSEIRFSKRFNAEYIRLFTGFTKAEEIDDEILENIVCGMTACIEECRKWGMKISIETHGRIEAEGAGVRHFNTSSTDPVLLSNIMSRLPDDVGLNYDPGNVKAVIDGDPIEFGAMFNDRINYCHLKDWIKLSDGTWEAAAVGDGTLDWEKVLGAMTFDGVYLIEYEPVRDIEDGIRRSIEYLESKFDVEY